MKTKMFETKIKDVLMSKTEGYWHVLILNGVVLPLEESLGHPTAALALTAVEKHLEIQNGN